MPVIQAAEQCPHDRDPASGRRRPAATTAWVYDELLARSLADGVHLVVAAVALPDPGSLALHRACGFDEAGTMGEVGHELGRWIDVMWLQEVLD